MIFETEYADSRQMLSWVLGLGPRAGSSTRRSWWRRPTTACAWWSTATRRVRDGRPGRKACRKSTRRKVENGKGDSPIRPERFARLVTLAGILIDAARDARKLHVADLRAAPPVGAGAAPGHRRPQRRELRRRQLRALRRGAGRHDRGRSRALRRQLRPPGAPPAARGQGARGRDRPARRAPSRGLARSRRARRSSRRFGQDPAEEGLQITTAKGDDSGSPAW